MNKTINIKRIIPIIFGFFLSNSGFTQSIEWIIKSKYDAISPFHEGVAAVNLAGKWGYINQQGKEIVKPEYEKVSDFHEGMGVISSDDSQLKAIVNSGGIISASLSFGLKVDPRFDKFSDGLLLVTDGKKWGYLNKSGGLQIGCKFTVAYPFSEGLAAVTASNYGIGGWAYINPSGNGVILQDNNFTWASSFNQGKAIVIFSKQLAFIDTRGKKTEENLPKLSSAMERYDTFKGELRCKEGTATFDGQGRLEYVETQATGKLSYIIAASKTENSLVQIKKEGSKSGFIINRKETPCQFDEVSWFDNSTAIVKKDTKLGIVSLDEKNSILITLKESTLFSIFGKPAEATVVVKNLMSDIINNLVLSFPNDNLQTINKLQPKESKELVLLLPKNSDAPTEENEFEIGFEMDGIQQNPIKIKSIIKDQPSLKIELANSDYSGIGNGEIPVTFQVNFNVINQSNISIDSLSVKIVDSQSKTLFDKEISIKGKERFPCSFNTAAITSQNRELHVIVKPLKAPPIKLVENIRLNIVMTGSQPTPETKSKSSGGVDTGVNVLEKNNK